MSVDVLLDMTTLDTPSRFTGTGRYVFELGAALADLTPAEREGLDIGALVSLQGPDAVGSLRWKGSETMRYGADREVAWLMDRRTKLPLTLRRLRPRLFHAPYQLGTPRGSGVPRVVSCLDLIPLILHQDYIPGRWAYRRLLTVAEALRFHAAKRVQAISKHTADDLMRVLGVPASRIDVVYLGADLARYRVLEGEAAAEAQRTRERLGLSERPYVFYAGMADPRKNVDVLIHAFARARVPDLDLVLVGKLRPRDLERVREALREAGDPPNVRLLGFVDEADLPALMGGAVAFVFCSTYEGFGNVPVEAMACGCPVITTGATAIAETVGEAAVFVPPRDVEATADAIRRVASDASLRRDLRAAGVARAQRFSWRNTALETVASYARALRD